MTAGVELVLGLDSGGTKTVLALADRGGSIHGYWRGPSLDPFAERAWPHHLGALIDTCAPWRGQLIAAALGLSCHGEVPAVSAAQIRASAALLDVPHLVLNDVRVAYDGALAGRAGVLLLAGTGSMAWAGDGRDRDARIGGWGSAFGDEGSAYWMGREALSEASRALDGRGARITFATELLRRLRLTPEGLIETVLASTHQRAVIAAVARSVDAMAEAGDDTARELLRRAAHHIADHASAALTRLGLPADAAWSYAGGVFGSRMVMAGVTARLGRPATPPSLPPVGGALLRAAWHCGWTVDDSWIARLSQTLSASEPEITIRIAQEGCP